MNQQTTTSDAREDCRFREREFEALMSACKGLVSKVCYMYSHDEEQFKELYQEVQINIWQAMDKFRGESQQSTWIYRVCINTCISCYRRNKRYASTMSMDNEEMLALADRATNDHEHAECLREMYRLINRLPAIDRAVVLMWLDEKSYNEIAEVTGLTRANVASRLFRIKQRLTKMGNS